MFGHVDPSYNLFFNDHSIVQTIVHPYSFFFVSSEGDLSERVQHTSPEFTAFPAAMHNLITEFNMQINSG